MENHEEETKDENEHDLRTWLTANKQARKRAEEKQDEVNANKRRRNIEAHLESANFEIPNTVVTRKEEMTDEQTNH
eukprot:11978765-Heterocapsa_arctica.AAC.1